MRSTQRCARARKADHSLPPLGVATSNVTDRAPGVDGARPGGTAATLWVVTLLIATIATTLQIHNGFELADMAWWTATR